VKGEFYANSRTHFSDHKASVNERIILKLMFKKGDGEVGMVFTWLQIGMGGRRV